MMASTGLSVGGLTLRSRAAIGRLLEVAVKNILTTALEFVLGLSLLGLSRAVPMMVEPHLGSLVHLSADTLWKFHFFAGAALGVGLFQVTFAVLNWSRSRLVAAAFAVPLSGALCVLFANVSFYGITQWTATLVAGNMLAVYMGDARERARAG